MLNAEPRLSRGTRSAEEGVVRVVVRGVDAGRKRCGEVCMGVGCKC